MINYNYDFNYIVDDSWIAASKTRNYLLNDPLVDYLEYNKKKRKRDDDTFHSLILANGVIFEDQIIEILNKKFPDQIKTIVLNDKSIIRDPKYFKLTIDMINQKVPIIYQGVLHNKINKTYGVPDLIIRGDYINKIYNTKIENLNESMYYIIDIKNSKLQLSAKSDLILNSISLKPYKSQIRIYHQIISQIQNVDTGIAFIMGNRWIRKQNNQIYQSDDPFDRLGIINYNNNDIQYINLTEEAINWNKQIRIESNNLNYLEPNHNNLYPNICNRVDSLYKKIKLELAETNAEITSLWMCGVKHRNNAIKHNIYKWTDPKLTSKILGINGNNGKILDKILKLNRSKSNIIYPKKIKSNIYNWRDRNSLSFYIDFETLYEINTRLTNNIIFMIGIGYSINNTWKYKCLLINNLSEDEQIKIINEMINYIKEISKINKVDYQNINIYHWSKFEPSILSKVCTKFNIIYPVFKWIDILELFHKEPIIIKGALNFSLKTIGKAMYNLNLISTIWPSDSNISDGLEAMYEAYKIYTNSNINNNIKMEGIIKYNEIDCKIMWDILNALNKIA